MDTVKDGVNGFLVGVEDAAGLADRLIRVLRLNEAEWKQMSDSALATAVSYTWDDATDLLEKALSDVMCGATAGVPCAQES